MNLRRTGCDSTTLLALAASVAIACGGGVVGSDTGPTDAGDVTAQDVTAQDVTAQDAADAPDVIASDATDAPPPVDVPVDHPGDTGPRVPLHHRPNDSACAAAPGPGDCRFGGHGPPSMCMMDSQCTMGTNGRCVMGNGGVAFCTCTYDACLHDSDCSMGGPCSCHGSPYQGGFGNACVPGNCRVDSDCGAGGYCSPAPSTMGCGGIGGYYCHTRSDECTDDADCNGHGTGPQMCTYDTSAGHWVCRPQLFCA